MFSRALAIVVDEVFAALVHAHALQAARLARSQARLDPCPESHGNVLGGGLELALCADIRISDETLRIGAPEVKWGLMQGAGATQRLPRFVPFAVALEMLFTGDPIGADRAERLGLVNQVVPVGQALAGAMDMATRISQRAPLGVRRAKEAAYAGWDQPLNEGLRTEMLLSRLLAGTEDLAEGQMAFAERRDPVWRAR